MFDFINCLFPNEHCELYGTGVAGTEVWPCTSKLKDKKNHADNFAKEARAKVDLALKEKNDQIQEVKTKYEEQFSNERDSLEKRGARQILHDLTTYKKTREIMSSKQIGGEVNV